jgi:inositol-hexakisphosphate/diphosphoinositol-pentakisphosphate 1-kinase
MRDDFKLLNRRVLDDVRVFTSSEPRVRNTAQIWTAAFLGRDDISSDYIQVKRDLLDDSNAAKDIMDRVKKRLKVLVRTDNVPEEFAWPKDAPPPHEVMQTVVELMRFHRKVMRYNFKKLIGGAAKSLSLINDSSDAKSSSNYRELIDVNTIQARWCTGEDAELFKERWEKLFGEFDVEKVDPSKISELFGKFWEKPASGRLGHVLDMVQ